MPNYFPNFYPSSQENELSSFSMSATQLMRVINNVTASLKNMVIPGVTTSTLVEAIYNAIIELSMAIGMTPDCPNCPDCPTLTPLDLTELTNSLQSVINETTTITQLITQTNRDEIQALATDINAIISISNGTTQPEFCVLSANIINSLHKVIYRINETTQALNNMRLNELQLLTNALNTLIQANKPS